MTSVGYIRQSRRADLDVALSYDAQLAAIQRLAGDAPVEILADMGRSGGAGKEYLRAGYQDLLARIEAGSVSAVYALNLTRLARSVPELYRFMERAKQHGVRITTAKEGTMDPTSATGKLTFGVFALLAEFVRDLAVESAAENVAVRRSRGDTLGRLPYGTRPGEDAGAVVDAFKTAGSWNGAARLLNTRELRSPQGRKWRPSSVRALVARYAPDLAPERRPAPGAAPSGGFRLSRLLRCSYCSTPERDRFLTGLHNRHRGGPVYRCHGADGDAAHPHPRAVAEREVLPWVMAEAARLRTPELIELMEANAQRRAELAGQRERVLDMYQSGILDKAERDRRLAALADRLDALDNTRRIATVPRIDWDWPAAQINAVLRALFAAVDLDATMRPVRAEWLVPEWRAG